MDPLGPVLAIVRLGVVLSLLFVLPGFALAPYLVPGASTPLARIGRAAGVGLLAAIAATTVLALLGLFRPTIVATVLAGLSILPLHADRPHWPRLSRRARRWWALVGALAILAGVLAIVPAIVLAGTGALPLAPSTWSGIPGAAKLAADGGLPAQFAAWNGAQQLGAGDLPSGAHLAAAIQLFPGDIETRLLVYRLGLTATTVVVTALLLRRWLPTSQSMLAAGLFAGVAGAGRPFLGDLFGAPWLALSLFAIWLVDRALVERSPRLLTTAGLVAATVLVARLDFFVACAAGVVAVSAARWIVAPAGGPETAGGLGHRYGRRIGLRRTLGRASLAPITAAAVALALAAGAGSVGSGALSIAAPASAVLGAVDGGGAGSGGGPARDWQRSDDPTLDFLAAAAGGTAAPATPSTRKAAATGLLGAGDGSPAGPLVSGLVIVAALVAWPLLDARRQRLVAVLVAFGLGLALTAIAIEGARGPFAARRFALDTLLPMEWLVTAAAAGLVGWLGAIAARRAAGIAGAAERDGRASLRGLALARRLAPWAGAGVVGAVAIAAIAGLGGTFAVSRTASDAYAWIASQTPADARILVNARTDGIVAALGGRGGVLDGPTAGPRDTDRLLHDTALLVGARAALADPAGDAARDFYATEAVTHLLVAAPDAAPGDVGAERTFGVDLAAIRSSDRYVPLASFGDRVWLFEVLPDP